MVERSPVRNLDHLKMQMTAIVVVASAAIVVELAMVVELAIVVKPAILEPAMASMALNCQLLSPD